MDLQLDGKTALVTGGSEGIGKGIARLLAKEGVDVAICARRKEPLEKAAAETAKETNRKIVPIVADLTKDAEARNFVEQGHKALGRVEVQIADVQDAIAVECARQPRQAEFYGTVADVQTVRDAALPQPAELEAQAQRELEWVQGHIQPRPVGRAAEDAPFHVTPRSEPGRRMAVLGSGGMIRRQIDRARNDFRQRRSSWMGVSAG